MNVALVAKRGSGKTTVSNALQARGYQRLSWADPVRQIAAMAYDRRFVSDDPAEYAAAKAATFEVSVSDANGRATTEVITGTQVLQRIGTDAIRDGLDLDFWVKAALRRIDETVGTAFVGDRLHTGTPVRWVNDDTRFPNELTALRSRGFLIVGLHVRDDIRIERLKARDGFYDRAAESHASENSVGLDDCDVVIDTTQPVDGVINDIIEATRAAA